MTPSEAAAVNVIISYISGKDPNPPAEVVRSMHLLARPAHKRLQGGWHEDAVRRQWEYAFESAQRAPVIALDPAAETLPTNPA